MRQRNHKIKQKYEKYKRQEKKKVMFDDIFLGMHSNLKGLNNNQLQKLKTRLISMKRPSEDLSKYSKTVARMINEMGLR